MKLALLALTLLSTLRAAGLVTAVKQAIAVNNFAAAMEMVRSYRTANGVTPESVEALSWIARGEFLRKNPVQADKLAQETYKLAVEQSRTYPVARTPNLQVALGAAIEVEANVMVTRGQRSEAIAYLQEQLRVYHAAPFRARIQKNINLLSLEGKRAPALEGVAIPAGKPVMLFFWAHWCGDCKYEGPIIARVREEFAPKGFTLITPTQKYGYIGKGDDAAPEVELLYIDAVRRQFYPMLLDAPAPVSEENFNKYGASTTPTLVLIDRGGIVRLYHPGVLTYDELRAKVAALCR
ncbi:MAG TPA: TlpA disulfide reductase family protein [Bryobacteraceae bacterium]|nr:TlpA disulfide reductase family protein [Bryobacteraceae bacterium]